MPEPIVTHSRVKELFEYDSDTGELYWLVSLSNRAPVGNPAGAFCLDGYIRIQIDGQMYLAHRLVWLWVYGRWPAFEIDHINHDRADNRLCNLREVANMSEQHRNASLSAANTSGVTGVYWEKRRKKYCASIMVNGRNKFLGYFDTIEEAAHARKAAEIKYGYHPNNGAPAVGSYG